MSRKQSILFIAMFIVLLCSWFYIYFLILKVKESKNKTLETEIRFNSLVKDFATLRSERDSISYIKDSLETIYNQKRKNIKNVIKKNEKAHDIISNLSYSESFYLFTENASRYRQNRERYIIFSIEN